MRKTLSSARLLLNEAGASLILLIGFWAILGSVTYEPITLWGAPVYVWTSSSWPFLLLLISYIPITLFLINKEFGVKPHEVGISWQRPDSPSPKPGLFFAKISLLACVIIFLTANTLAFLGMTGVIITRSTDMVSYADAYNIKLVLLPFWEEFIIRGIICAFVARRWGWWPALLISGTVFIGIHICAEPASWKPTSLYFWIFLVFDSYFLSWLYYRTRVLWVPTLWHMVGNTIMLIFVSYPETLTWGFRLITPV